MPDFGCSIPERSKDIQCCEFARECLHNPFPLIYPDPAIDCDRKKFHNPVRLIRSRSESSGSLELGLRYAKMFNPDCWQYLVLSAVVTTKMDVNVTSGKTYSGDCEFETEDLELEGILKDWPAEVEINFRTGCNISFANDVSVELEQIRTAEFSYEYRHSGLGAFVTIEARFTGAGNLYFDGVPSVGFVDVTFRFSSVDKAQEFFLLESEVVAILIRYGARVCLKDFEV